MDDFPDAMRSRRSLILAVGAACALAWASPAAAAANPYVELGLGADWLVEPLEGAFQLTLGGQNHINPHLSWGGRIGLLYLANSGRLGLPLDARLRGHFGPIYVEGLVGPWLIFRDTDPLRFHGAIGFGLATRHVNAGVEVGVLNRGTLVGLRLAFPL